MRTTDIKYLCKVFKEKPHALNFCAGNILLTQLGHFTQIEANIDPRQDDPRRDRQEGTSCVVKPGHPGRLCVAPPGGHPIDVPVKFVRINFSPPEVKNCYVLCMYAGVLEHDESLPPGNALACLRPHTRCSEFGPWVVVLKDHMEFLSRLKLAAEKDNWKSFDHRLVEYYPTDHTQMFDLHDAPFRKEISFSWQSEYRIVLRSEPVREPRGFLSIGDISDIAMVFSLDEFSSGLRLTQDTKRTA
jgi:hypothetical protein